MLSTMMGRIRVALGIRNNHGLILNLLYMLYARYAKSKSKIFMSPRDLVLSSHLRKRGIAVLGQVDVNELSGIVDDKMREIPINNGYAQFPRIYNPLIVPHVFKVLQEKGNVIEAYYQSYFQVNWFEVQKIAPGEQPLGSSFGYHTDDTPSPIIKLFIYLTDTYESNGAFRGFEYSITDKLLNKGMLVSASPGLLRERAQLLVEPELEKELTIVEGKKGTVFLFDNNLIHKGTLPRQGTRTHVSMEIMPSTKPLTLKALMKDCDKEINVYFPPNPFSQSGNIGDHQ